MKWEIEHDRAVTDYLADPGGKSGGDYKDILRKIEAVGESEEALNLALNDGDYTASLYSPTLGPIGERDVAVEGRQSSIALPAFVDDIMIQITPAATQ